MGWGGGPHLCHGQVTDPGCSPKAEAFLSCAIVSWIFALEAQSLPLMNSLHLPRKVPEFSHASAVGTHHYVRAPWVLPCQEAELSLPQGSGPTVGQAPLLHTFLRVVMALRKWMASWRM